MDLSFFWMSAAGFVLRADELLIGSDPCLSPKGTEYPFATITVDPDPAQEVRDKIGLWLITHAHGDHLDEPGIAFINDTASLIVNPTAAEMLGERDNPMIALEWTEIAQAELSGMRVGVEAVPAIHGSTPEMVEAMGQVNGYYLALHNGTDQVRAYITGDTVADEQVLDHLEGRRIDLLIANVGAAYASKPGGPITMTAKMLQTMIERLKPQTTIPIHQTAFSHWEMTEEDLEEIAGFEGVIMPKRGEWMGIDL